MEAEEKVFTHQELMDATGWAQQTTKAMLIKKLAIVVHRTEGGYRCISISHIPVEAFCRLCSQSAALANDPQRPRMSAKVEGLVNKAREAALAAVQHYNNPSAMFRSGNYIVLMIIAYTALFHAIFERDEIAYIATDSNGNPKLIGGGETMLWDVQKCVDHYEKGQSTPMVRNIEFFIPLRHKIEHRFMPEIDPEIAGHCQAMLMNFERVMTQEFTLYYALNTSLAQAIQFSTRRSTETIETLRRLQNTEYREIKTYLTQFHDSLPDEIIGDPAFFFRMWLIPKPANHARSSDMSIEFVSLKDATTEQLELLERSVVAVKTTTRDKVADPAKDCDMWEQEVVRDLQQALGATVDWGDRQQNITGRLVRMVRSAHRIPTPSAMYYRPDKPGSRAMYGKAFVDWILAEYDKDHGFFYKANVSNCA